MLFLQLSIGFATLSSWDVYLNVTFSRKSSLTTLFLNCNPTLCFHFSFAILFFSRALIVIQWTLYIICLYCLFAFTKAAALWEQGFCLFYSLLCPYHLSQPHSRCLIDICPIKYEWMNWGTRSCWPWLVMLVLKLCFSNRCQGCLISRGPFAVPLHLMVRTGSRWNIGSAPEQGDHSCPGSPSSECPEECPETWSLNLCGYFKKWKWFRCLFFSNY